MLLDIIYFFHVFKIDIIFFFVDYLFIFLELSLVNGFSLMMLIYFIDLMRDVVAVDTI